MGAHAYVTYEKKAFDQWRQEYLKAEASAEMAYRTPAHASSAAQ